MNKYIKESLDIILSNNYYSKKIIAIIIDVILCILSTWLAFALRLEQLILFKDFNFLPAIISIIIAIPIFFLFELYRTIFRYTSLSILLTILAATSLYGLLYFLVIGVYSFNGVPRSVGIIQPMLLFFGIIISRLGAKFILNYNFNSKKYK